MDYLLPFILYMCTYVEFKKKKKLRTPDITLHSLMFVGDLEKKKKKVNNFAHPVDLQIYNIPRLTPTIGVYELAVCWWN